MGARTEQTANGLATYSEPTFRTYPMIRTMREDGSTVIMQLCEEWVEGRWEPFYAIIDR